MAYASGKRAYGISDRSGRRYRLRDMRKEWTGSLVGPDEFEAKHPQLLPLKPFPDPQALRNPRPDQVESKSKVLLELNPFFVSVVDSNQLTVYEPGHGKTTGDRVRFTNAQSFQDFYAKTLNRSEGYIITVTSVDEYTITVEAPTEPTLNQSTAQYDNMVSVGILAASVQVNTDNQMVLFNNNQAINGRPLGDVTGNNDLSVNSWRKIFNQVKDKCNSIHPDLPKLIEINLKDVEKGWPENLPKGIIHADLFHDNIFFKNDNFSGFIDFYFSCNDFYAFEIAICFNALCFDGINENLSFNVTKAKKFFDGYDQVRKISNEEKKYIKVLSQGAALRFLLTRVFDSINMVDDAVVKIKDPIEYLKRLEFHKNSKNFEDYII